MRSFSAQFVVTNSGQPLKRAVITTEDDGEIISIENNDGALKEKESVEFYNGIIIPGFVNCHPHLELSHLKNTIPEGEGLPDFIMQVRTIRDDSVNSKLVSSESADRQLTDEGIVLCADVCNTSESFKVKKNSRITYINFLEVFGIDPRKAGKRMDEILAVARDAAESGMLYSIVPHSLYSVSLPLFRMIKEYSALNKVTSVHFMETEDEIAFLSDHSGGLMKSYRDSGILPDTLHTVYNHASAVLGEITQSGNLILVHNTFVDRNLVNQVKKRGNTYWCLCPGSNMYIEAKMPPVDLLYSEGCTLVIGTDSLASNKKLSILSEIKLIQHHFPDIPLEKLIEWATINGAKALCMEDTFGSIVIGARPGLLLLENVDLINFKLLPGSTVTRLV